MSKIDDYIIFEYLEGNLPEEQARAVQQQIESDPILSSKTAGFAASFIDNATMKFPKQANLIKPWYATFPWKSIGVTCITIISVIILWPKNEVITYPSKTKTYPTTSIQENKIIISPLREPKTPVKPITAKTIPSKYITQKETTQIIVNIPLPLQTDTVPTEIKTQPSTQKKIEEDVVRDTTPILIKKEDKSDIVSVPISNNVKEATAESAKKTMTKFAKREIRRQEKYQWKLQKKRERMRAPTLKETLQGLKWSNSPPVKLED